MDEKLIRLPDVMGQTGQPKSSLYADMAKGTFPSPVKIGARAVAWRQSDIQGWIASRVSARPAVQGAQA